MKKANYESPKIKELNTRELKELVFKLLREIKYLKMTHRVFGYGYPVTVYDLRDAYKNILKNKKGAKRWKRKNKKS